MINLLAQRLEVEEKQPFGVLTCKPAVTVIQFFHNFPSIKLFNNLKHFYDLTGNAGFINDNPAFTFI